VPGVGRFGLREQRSVGAGFVCQVNDAMDEWSDRRVLK
jgi:hypothetical protein